MPFRYLLASPTGNGCGLAILRVDGGPVVAISVLPKLWPTVAAADVCVDDTSAVGILHVAVRELQVLRLSGSSEAALDASVVALTNLRFEVDADDVMLPASSKPVDALFQELTATDARSRSPELSASDRDTQFASELQLADAFWTGVEDLGATDLVRVPLQVPTDDAALLGRRLLSSLPALERVLREVFIAEAEAALKRRMPDFRTTTEPLSFIRGSLTQAGLRRAVLGGVTDLECSFAELDHDHPWQQVIRAAAHRVAVRDQREGTGSGRLSRCRRIDRRLLEVAVVRDSGLLRQNYDERALGKNRHASVAARLGLAILRRDSPVGYAGSRTRDLATATGLRLSTARLFERMLTTPFEFPAKFVMVENRERVALLKGQPATKRPDLLLIPLEKLHSFTVADSVALVDAKYKTRTPEVPGAMEMGDQYQQFAYATATGKPTVFVFASGPDREPRASPWFETNGVQAGAGVAVASIPCPQPSRPWRGQLADALRALVPMIVEGSPPVAVPSA
jgi:hypothetical protein